MRTATITLMIALIAMLAIPGSSKAEIRAGISMENGELKDVHIVYRDRDRSPRQRPVILPRPTRDRDVVILPRPALSDRDMRVARFIASRAHVNPRVVVRKRIHGMTWIDVARCFHLSAEVFFIADVNRHAHGRLNKDRQYREARKNMHRAWKRFVKDRRKGFVTHLSDNEIRNLVEWQAILQPSDFCATAKIVYHERHDYDRDDFDDRRWDNGDRDWDDDDDRDWDDDDREYEKDVRGPSRR